MNGNYGREDQVVRGDYRLSATGILQASGETMRHIQNTLEGRENIISAKSLGTLALQNAHTFILNSQAEIKSPLLEVEAISGTGIQISASFRSKNLDASKAKLFFAIGVVASNFAEFYPRDSNLILQKISTDFKKVSGAYIKSSYLAPQNTHTQKESLRPKPIPYRYINQEEPKNQWRDTSLDSWHNPYAPKEQKQEDDWQNPYLKENILDDGLDDWKNPYEKSEPILESKSFDPSPLDYKSYPRDDGIEPNSIKISFLDPLAEMLGTSEINLSTNFLGEFNIRGLKQALINKYPHWRDKLSTSNLMFSVNRQVSMSEFDAVNDGSSVTIFING